MDDPSSVVNEKGIAVTNLVSSSEDSWVMKGRVNFSPMAMRPDPSAEKQSYTLAVLLSGKFSSFFKGKDIPEPDKKKKKAGRLSTRSRLDESLKSGKPEIIVVGTAELARSGFLMDSRKVLARGQRDQGASNDNLVHGMVDYMAGNPYVPEMLAKSLDYIPLEATEKGERYFAKSLNMGVVPLLVILAGIVMWRYRNRRKKAIAVKFGGGISNE